MWRKPITTGDFSRTGLRKKKHVESILIVQRVWKPSSLGRAGRKWRRIWEKRKKRAGESKNLHYTSGDSGVRFKKDLWEEVSSSKEGLDRRGKEGEECGLSIANLEEWGPVPTAGSHDRSCSFMPFQRGQKKLGKENWGGGPRMVEREHGDKK